MKDPLISKGSPSQDGSSSQVSAHSFKNALLDLLKPLKQSPHACLYTLGALALLLVYLHQGHRDFFARHLATYWLSSASESEIVFWGTLYQFTSAFILFLLIPALVLKFIAKESLTALGLGLGDWRTGLLVVLPLGLVLLALPGGYMAAQMPDFLTEYPLSDFAAADPQRFLLFELAYGLLYYVAYEAFFRGFLQMGLARQIGDLSAILVQTAITTLLHIGKPEGEIWSAMLAGFIFGVLVIRLRSVWPLVLIHWGLGTATEIFCANARNLF